MKTEIDTDNLKSAVFGIQVRVYYQDTDAGGVVYHSTYLNFMERARYEWMRELEFNVNSLVQIQKVIFMVHSLNITYSKPAILDDLLDITVQVKELGGSRIALSQQVLRDRITLAVATIYLVCVDADTLKPVSLPVSLRAKFENSP